MIFVTSAEKADISINTVGTGSLRAQGSIATTTLNFITPGPASMLAMLRVLEIEHRQYTDGSPLCVFDMSGAVEGHTRGDE